MTPQFFRFLYILNYMKIISWNCLTAYFVYLQFNQVFLFYNPALLYIFAPCIVLMFLLLPRFSLQFFLYSINRLIHFISITLGVIYYYISIIIQRTLLYRNIISAIVAVLRNPSEKYVEIALNPNCNCFYK